MASLGDPTFTGVAMQESRKLGFDGDADFDFRTGMPFPAYKPRDGTTEPPFLYDRIKLSRSAMCELWYECKKLLITAPRAPTGHATLKYLFPASGDHPSYITYPTPAGNDFAPCGNSFFFPVAWIWSMDAVEGGPDLISINLDAEIDARRGIFPYTDGKKIFPNMTFTIIYLGSDSLPHVVRSNKNSDSDVQVGEIQVLGQISKLWGDLGEPEYGTATVTKEESW